MTEPATDSTPAAAGTASASTATPAAPVAPRARRPKGRGRIGPPSPAARFEPGTVGEVRHRNPLWLAGGLLLVVLCGLGGVLLFTSSDDRQPVVVSAGELEPGRPLTRADLRVIDMAVADGIGSLSPTDASALIGQLPVGQIPAGTLLNPAMFAAEAALAPGEMVFGAALDPGEVPLSQVDVGADVELLSVPKSSTAVDPPTTNTDAATTPAAASIGTGVVWAVETLGNGQVWVSVRASRPVGLVASQAAQDDALRVVLVGGGS